MLGKSRVGVISEENSLPSILHLKKMYFYAHVAHTTWLTMYLQQIILDFSCILSLKVIYLPTFVCMHLDFCETVNCTLFFLLARPFKQFYHLLL